MKLLEIIKIMCISIIFGFIILSSVFLEGNFSFYADINDLVLYIPRLFSDEFYKCWICPEELKFIAISTFIFYTFIAFITIILIKIFRKK